MPAYTSVKLFPHQERIIKKNPPKAILAHEMRTGKSLIGAYWIDNPAQAGNTYIICPKQLVKSWKEYNTKAKVISKEEFKKIRSTIKNPTAIVVDEAHVFSAPLFLKGRSQLATALYTLVQEYPDMHILLLTATPIRQDAWSLHTLFCYIGTYYTWKLWRDEFFELRRMPFLRFPAYFPRENWRTAIRPYLEKHCSIVSLRDIVEYLPPMEPVFIHLKQASYNRPVDEVVTWTAEHLWEQQGKAKEILKLGQGFRKILVVAHYTHQIDELEGELLHDKPVFVLDGRTKDAAATIKAAQESDDCYFLCQASMGFGFDGWMFSAMVFASMSHSCVSHTQMLGRMRHLKHLKTVPLYYIFAGRWDRRIYETIRLGRDFSPHEYRNETTTTPASA